MQLSKGFTNISTAVWQPNLLLKKIAFVEPRIEILAEKKLVGRSISMSLSSDRTAELWQGFMPRRKEITNALSTELICMQVFDHSLEFGDFNPQTVFEKWAAVEVADFNHIPEGMKSHTLQGGLYAVFKYVGLPSEFAETFHHIFYTWLPNSAYVLDKREHFELLGDRYKNNDRNSEEEVWIPIKRKE